MLLEDGSVEIWLPPKQMTICGKAVRRKEKRDEEELHPYQRMVFPIVTPNEIYRPKKTHDAENDVLRMSTADHNPFEISHFAPPFYRHKVLDLRFSLPCSSSLGIVF